MSSFPLRATAVALLTGGLLLPAAAFAAPEPQTGTVVGPITCGPAEDAPASRIVVTAEGLNVQTLTSSAGKFVLTGLPSGQTFNIDAIADPQSSSVVSRFDVSLAPGETLDIGSLDLPICGQPAPMQPSLSTQDQAAPDFAQDLGN